MSALVTIDLEPMWRLHSNISEDELNVLSSRSHYTLELMKVDE